MHGIKSYLKRYLSTLNELTNNIKKSKKYTISSFQGSFVRSLLCVIPIYDHSFRLYFIYSTNLVSKQKRKKRYADRYTNTDLLFVRYIDGLSAKVLYSYHFMDPMLFLDAA